MPVVFQKMIHRKDLRANPSIFYVFGDNLVKEGYGGQAFAMRGEPNAVGIPTKRAPDTSRNAYFYDVELDEFASAVKPGLLFLEKLLASGATIVMPMDGIGGGRAKLNTQAPELWKWLNTELTSLGLVYQEKTNVLHNNQPAVS